MGDDILRIGPMGRLYIYLQYIYKYIYIVDFYDTYRYIDIPYIDPMG